MPPVTCTAPQGATFAPRESITFRFVHDQVQPVAGAWVRNCANDEHSQPLHREPFSLPTVDITVTTFAQLRAAINDTSNTHIQLSGNAFSSTEAINVTATQSMAGRRYLSGSGTLPKLVFAKGAQWVVTGLNWSDSRYPSTALPGESSGLGCAMWIHDSNDVIVDGCRRVHANAGESTIIVTNGRNGSNDNIFIQRNYIEFTGGTSEMMAVIWRSWLPDFASSEYWPSAEPWPARGNNFWIQSNEFIGNGDGVQFHAELYSSAASNRHYTAGKIYNSGIRGNFFDGKGRQENAIDTKMSSDDPDNPFLIYNNFFTNYRPAAGGGADSAGSCVVSHFREQYIRAYWNVFHNATRGYNFKPKDGILDIEDNVFIDVDELLLVEVPVWAGEDDYFVRDIEVNFNRNVCNGANQIGKIGNSGIPHGTVSMNCNFFDSLPGGTGPIQSGTTPWGNAVSVFAGSNNTVATGGVGNIPGATASNWLGNATTATHQLGPCGSTSGTASANLPAAADVPTACDEFVWAS